MSYNPNRHNSNNPVPRRVRRLAPTAGKKHSSIVSRQGPIAFSSDDMSRRETTKAGWRTPQYKGKNIELFLEYICAGNTSGTIKNTKGEKSIRVLSGEIFVILDGVVNKLFPGQLIGFDSGTEYELATSGQLDAEILVCQTVDYDKSIKNLSPAIHNSDPKILDKAVESKKPKVKTPRKSKLSPETVAEWRATTVNSTVVEDEKGNKVVAKRGPAKKRAPLPGQMVEGMSPRPLGAAAAEAME